METLVQNNCHPSRSEFSALALLVAASWACAAVRGDDSTPDTIPVAKLSQADAIEHYRQAQRSEP